MCVCRYMCVCVCVCVCVYYHSCAYVCTCMCKLMHAYKHTYVHTNIHTSTDTHGCTGFTAEVVDMIHAYVHTSTHTYKQININTSIHTYIRVFIYRFTAEIVVLQHHTTMSNNYQPVVSFNTCMWASLCVCAPCVYCFFNTHKHDNQQQLPAFGEY
jgi:hypothetical protein